MLAAASTLAARDYAPTAYSALRQLAHHNWLLRRAQARLSRNELDGLYRLVRTQALAELVLGDAERARAWLAAQSSLLLRVPSAVVGRSFNRLFNPLHAQAASCRVVSVARYPFDDRLLARR